MTVTALDVGQDVTWTENGRQHTGRLVAMPEPGSRQWFQTGGKVTVLTEDGWVYIRPSDLVLATPTEVPDARG